MARLGAAGDRHGYNLRPDGEGTETGLRRTATPCLVPGYNLRPDGEGTETYLGSYDLSVMEPASYNLRPDGEGTETTP